MFLSSFVGDDSQRVGCVGLHGHTGGVGQCKCRCVIVALLASKDGDLHSDNAAMVKALAAEGTWRFCSLRISFPR